MTTLRTTYDNLTGVLATLEAERRQRLGRIRRATAIAIVMVLAGGAVSIVFYKTMVGAYVTLVLALFYRFCASSKQKGRYLDNFRTRLMPELVKALGEDLHYHPDSCMDETEFDACGLFTSPDRYHGRDLVDGYVGQTRVRFSLVDAEEQYTVTDTVTETDSDGNTTYRTETRTEYRTIFCGLLFSADCNKHFSGWTLLHPGKTGFFTKRRSSTIVLEDPAFMDTFRVSSSDQIEARYLLTPSLMDRIMELRSRAGKGMCMSFVDDHVWVAVPMSFNAFTPRITKRADDPAFLAAYYYTLSFIVGIIEDLDLNTRIWSKRP